jgi:hypothetical protein
MAGNYWNRHDRMGPPKLTGQETVWDDLMIPGFSVRNGAVAPDFSSGFVGDAALYMLTFDGGSTVEEVHFSLQLPHCWKEGSTIYPHVHFVPWSTNSSDTNERTVRFSLDYTWASIFGTFGAKETYHMNSDPFVPNTSQWRHLLAKNSTGISGAGHGISSMMVCRLFRDGGDAADTYPQDVGFLQFDIHFEVDALGSDAEYIK